jgi:predicted nucleotidyltransferase
MNAQYPTPDLELNSVLDEFVASVQRVLGNNFVAAYLQGSFALGDWDNDSDVDFTIVVEREVSDTELADLQTMHARLFNLKSEWAKHLEGSYFPKIKLKKGDPEKTKLPYLDNTHDKLIMSDHDNTLVVRWVVRECGITLAGSDPKELIDPVSADDLRHEVAATMREWAEEIFTGKWGMNNRWAQPFAVLSYCRMLHTLETGRIASKLAGAEWARNALDINSTLEFIRFALSSTTISSL